MGRIRRAEGDLDGAEAALAYAEAVDAPRAVVPVLPALVDRLRVLLWLDRGNLQAARLWAARQTIPAAGKLGMVEAFRGLTIAQVRLTDGDPAGALVLLDRIAAETEAQGHRDMRIKTRIWQALVIATGTVKAHTARIYGKLGVHNRTEAAARAHELGLL